MLGSSQSGTVFDYLRLGIEVCCDAYIRALEIDTDDTGTYIQSLLIYVVKDLES